MRRHPPPLLLGRGPTIAVDNFPPIGRDAARFRRFGNDRRRLLETPSRLGRLGATAAAPADPSPRRAQATIVHREDATDADRAEECHHSDYPKRLRLRGSNHGRSRSRFLVVLGVVSSDHVGMF